MSSSHSPSPAALRLEVAHNVVHVHDLDATIEFYRDMLGFEVTDRGFAMGEEVCFMSQTADAHHQVAFTPGKAGDGKSNNVHHTAYRSQGTLADLKALLARLEAHEGVTEIMPFTHGNAWSIYFIDPEMNGVEVFLDTPWHVPQPQGEPLDLSLSDEEIIATTKAAFDKDPGFKPFDDFRKERAEHLARRLSAD